MKKIMFNDRFGLTQAVLEGRKTMTRRVVPTKLLDSIKQYAHGSENELCYRLRANATYNVGDIVAIAQAYKDIFKDAYHIGLYGRTAGWTNKLFVAAYRMPHHIKITKVRIEYLQDISDEDCLREGIYLSQEEFGKPSTYTFSDEYLYMNPRSAFAALIDKVSGKGTWKSNPLVWVYEFELVD